MEYHREPVVILVSEYKGKLCEFKNSFVILRVQCKVIQRAKSTVNGCKKSFPDSESRK